MICTYDYYTELKNILNKVYENKIYNIALKNNIKIINKDNLNNIINIFKSTHVYLGSDLDEFIINLMPKDDAGYFFRVEIAKHFNYSYPKLYDYRGNPIKSANANIYALRLWQSSMEELFTDNIHREFNKEDFFNYVENNLLSMADDISEFIDSENKKKEIIIPIKNKSELLPKFKSMILNKELDSSWIEFLVDIDELRSDMEKFAATFDMYNEFDKLEDSLEECIDNFCKYTSEELYDVLLNEKEFKFIDDIGLVKTL
ncbi:Uncharacterised protein [uncultured Clostridium sp.]|nr:Uncharacterised protein [uncultured Clostridium sp.]